MIELELFFKTVEEKIRRDHTNYLENMKRVPSPPPKKRWWQFWKRNPVPVEDELLKSYNAGIKKVLHILKVEYSKFNRRLLKAEKEAEKEDKF